MIKFRFVLVLGLALIIIGILANSTFALPNSIGIGIACIGSLMLAFSLFGLMGAAAAAERQQLENMDRLSVDQLTERITALLEGDGGKVVIESDKRDRRILSIIKPDGSKAIAIVKRSFKDIGVSEVRSLYGLVADAGAKEGYFFTNERFTLQAKKWSTGKPLYLVDEDTLNKMASASNLKW